jgi:hypothetical protein
MSKIKTSIEEDLKELKELCNFFDKLSEKSLEEFDQDISYKFITEDNANITNTEIKGIIYEDPYSCYNCYPTTYSLDKQQ